MINSKNKTHNPNLLNRILFKNKRRSLLPILICTLGLLLGACSDNSTGTDGGNGGGGDEIGTEPTFSNVGQILEQNCGGSGCHVGERTRGVRLDSYDNVMNSEGTQYGELIVQENNPAGSPLVDKIEPSPDHGQRMPQGGPYLSDDRIDQIRDWINNGANND